MHTLMTKAQFAVNMSTIKQNSFWTLHPGRNLSKIAFSDPKPSLCVDKRPKGIKQTCVCADQAWDNDVCFFFFGFFLNQWAETRASSLHANRYTRSHHRRSEKQETIISTLENHWKHNQSLENNLGKKKWALSGQRVVTTRDGGTIWQRVETAVLLPQLMITIWCRYGEFQVPKGWGATPNRPTWESLM